MSFGIGVCEGCGEDRSAQFDRCSCLIWRDSCLRQGEACGPADAPLVLLVEDMATMRSCVALARRRGGGTLLTPPDSKYAPLLSPHVRLVEREAEPNDGDDWPASDPDVSHEAEEASRPAGGEASSASRSRVKQGRIYFSNGGRLRATGRASGTPSPHSRKR